MRDIARSATAPSSSAAMKEAIVRKARESADTMARVPIRTNWWMPTSPDRTARSPTSTNPVSPV